MKTDNPLDLITYCVRENVPFTVFEDWSSILSTVRDITEGKTTVQAVSASGAQNFLEETRTPDVSAGRSD
jgi:hypothetical protein